MEGGNPFLTAETARAALERIAGNSPWDPLCHEPLVLSLEWEILQGTREESLPTPLREYRSWLRSHRPPDRCWRFFAAALCGETPEEAMAPTPRTLTEIFGMPFALAALLCGSSLPHGKPRAVPLAPAMPPLLLSPDVRLHLDERWQRPFSAVTSAGTAHLFCATWTPDDAFARALLAHELGHVAHLRAALRNGEALHGISVWERELCATRMELAHIPANLVSEWAHRALFDTLRPRPEGPFSLATSPAMDKVYAGASLVALREASLAEEVTRRFS